MTRMQGDRCFWFGSLLMFFAFFCACAQTAPVSYTSPPPPPSTPPGQVENGRFVHPEYRLQWLNPGDWQAVWPHNWDEFDFAWVKGSFKARLWLLGNKASPRETGLNLAKTQGWEACQAKIISWQGYPAWDAQIFESGLAGRLRTVKSSGGMVAVSVLSPHGDQGKEAAKLAGVIDGLYFAPPGDILHVVQHPNESLSVIAKWYTDSAADWPRLKEYNGLVGDILVLGQVILIPARLVTRMSPLPAWAVPPLPKKSNQKRFKQQIPGNEPGSGIRLMPIGPK